MNIYPMNKLKIDEIKTICHYSGYVCILLGLFMLLPMISSIIFHDDKLYMNSFIISSAISIGIGLCLFSSFKRKNITVLSLKGALLFVLSLWGITAIISGLPYFISGNLNFFDSFIEGMSSITTTSFSILPIYPYPYSIALWESLTQWFGGLGLIILILVIVPSSTSLRQLYFAEGKTEQMTPNLRHTTTIFIKLYLILTSISIVLFLIAGLTPFYAICYGLCTIATGGFSVNPEVVHYFNTPLIQFVTIIIMLMGSSNFIILYRVIKGNFKNIFKDIEIKTMIRIIALATICITLSLYSQGFYGSDIIVIFRHALFQTISVMSSTGYSTTSTVFWPSFCIHILILLMFIGGSVCSTSGGIKIYNIVILLKSIWWEVQSMILPKNTVILRKVYHDNKNREITPAAIRTIHVYVIAYVLLFIISAFLLLIYCDDFQTAYMLAAASLGNMGFGPQYLTVSSPLLVKIVMVVDFWIGRIGIWPLLIFIVFGSNIIGSKIEDKSE
ncbi:TrkH family potassium uptake protein [Methanosphaera sp.]